jgi:hypothetical protein
MKTEGYKLGWYAFIHRTLIASFSCDTELHADIWIPMYCMITGKALKLLPYLKNN